MSTPRLSPGDRVPPFTLPAVGPGLDGEPRSLQDLLAEVPDGGGLVLWAYPAAGTPGCTGQACDFRDDRALAAAGYRTVGISPDPVAKLLRFRDEHGLTGPLLSDPGKEVLTSLGAYGEKQLYGKTVVGVIRSTLLLDRDGVVQRALYGVRAKGHVAKLVKDLGLPAA